GLTNERLSMKNCDLVFIIGDGVEVPASRSNVVEITGQLESRQGKQIFLVTRLKMLPNDNETLSIRRSRLLENDASGWYALADWAAGRGKFYEDTTLVLEAVSLRRTGLLIEYRQVGIDDVDALYALAKKAESLK